MKRLYIIMTAMLLGLTQVMAQPGPVQKMAKSVFTLTTFNKEGNIIASTQGVFIDNKGTALQCNQKSYLLQTLSHLPGSVLHHI